MRDPHCGNAVPPGRSASVRARLCVHADALAKCVLLLGGDSTAILRQYQAEGFLIDGAAAFVIDGACSVDADAGGADGRSDTHVVGKTNANRTGATR